MTIRKQKSGKYQADVLDKNGKRIRKTFSKKAEARSFSTLIEREKVEEKLIRNKVVKRKVSFSEAISRAVKSKDMLAPKSISKYNNVYKTLEEFVTRESLVYLNDFSTDHADKFRDILSSSGASAKTVNFYLHTVKAVFKEYVIRDLLIRNPFDHVKLEKQKHKTLLEREEDYYSSAEITNFFKQDMPEDYRNCFIGLFLTGMRFGELSSLKWIRVDLSSRIIQVRSDSSFQAKTQSSERDIPISDRLFKLLQGMKDKTQSEFVFSTGGGKSFSERRTLSVCKNVAERAGIDKNATLHKWRHSFSSHLSQFGVDYAVRQYLLGHKPQSMTDHYTKIDPKKLHGEVSKLDQLIP